MKKNSNPKTIPQTIKGTIKINFRGIGYLKVLDLKEDIEIENFNLKTALNNDEVEVRLLSKTKEKRQQGEVVNILKRSKDQFVGIVEKKGVTFFLKADDRKLYRDIIIEAGANDSQIIGKKVLVKITSWGDAKKNPEGKLVEVLGDKGSHEVEIRSIVLERGLDMEFPKDVEDEAKKVAEESVRKMREGGIEGRRDFRSTPTCTIDPVDAKDFDDALSLVINKDGTLEVGVHIADVSHYVREGSHLDQEAIKRGFSIYLVDRTIPMLPEILSNELCSLNPDEDRLAFSAVFKMDRKGKVLSRWFGKSIIRSQKRFSYEEAQKTLNEKTGKFFEELDILNNISKNLRQERFRSGAIDFDTDEVRFELDPMGKPIRVFRKARLETHKLVEELMLLANKEVAKFVFEKNKKGSGFIFRTHDMPDKEKIKSLSVFLRALGYTLKLDNIGSVSSKDLNALFTQIEGKAEESLIKTAAVRSMAKAIYSTRNSGHFGLAFDYYTHFTSPIRRYPDLLVHRFLEKSLQGKKLTEDLQKFQKLAAEMSEKEIKVSEAERASIKYKQVEFMLPNIGKTFSGVISGITEWGIYVEEIETRAEGMIKLRDIGDDFYELNEKQYSLIGKKTKRKFQLGDKVQIKVKRVDLDQKQIDYALV
ncbi:MAG: ribonuclease R [Patescibacteria group bacterium]